MDSGFNYTVVFFELVNVSLALFSILFMLLRNPLAFFWAIVCMGSIALFSMGKLTLHPPFQEFKMAFITSPAWRLIVPPAFYLFLRDILGRSKLPTWKIGLHFLPFLFFYTMFFLSFHPGLEPVGHQPVHPPPLLGMPYISSLIGVYVAYFWIILRMIAQHQKEYVHFFSYSDNYTTLRWVRWLVIGLFVLFIGNSIFILLFPPFPQGGTPLALVFVHFFHLAVVLFFALFVVNQPILFQKEWRESLEEKNAQITETIRQISLKTETPFEEEKTTVVDSEKEPVEPDASSDTSNFSLKDLSTMELLQNYMKTKQPFLQPKLKIADLAEDIGTTPHYLSKLINDYYGYNFFYFINYYRVEHAQKLLEQSEADLFTIEGVGMQAGFNSRGTFSTWFKKVTGRSPGEYRKRAKK